MRPGVGRIDGRRERAVEPLDALVVLALGGRGEGPVVRSHHSFGEVVRREPGDACVARLQRQAELGDETQVRGVERPDDLAAELHRAAVVDPELLDAPADSLPGLEHRDVGTSESEVACCGEAGKPRSEHEDVGQAPLSSRAIVSRISRTASSRSTRSR